MLLILFMNTSWKQSSTCKSCNIKNVWNTKTSQYHITATPHYYRKTFCSFSYILVVHFTASTIWGLQKIGLVGMVSYHYRFQISKTLPKFEWSCFSWSNFDLAFAIAQIFIIYANLNDTIPICPDSFNCTQVWMKLF